MTRCIIKCSSNVSATFCTRILHTYQTTHAGEDSDALEKEKEKSFENQHEHEKELEKVKERYRTQGQGQSQEGRTDRYSPSRPAEVRLY